MNKVSFQGLKINALFLIYDKDSKPVVFRKSIDPIWGRCVASDSLTHTVDKYYKFGEDQQVIKL